jgi:hypothetical protein
MMIMMPEEIKAQTTIKQQMEYLQNTKGANFIYDANINLKEQYCGPSLSNMPLKKAIKQLFNNSNITYEFKGRYILLHDKNKKPKEKKGRKEKKTVSETKSDHHADNVNEDKTLDEVVVEGNKLSPLLATQTGKRTLQQKDIKTEFSLLSSPDLVKTLQRMPGVAEGVELASGLYVHGGADDENLFLLDGTPLYNVNHSLGLFSAFNADIIKSVDFYKSGFPARYSGRTSSVVDVETKEGDMQKTHGEWSLGIIDGRFHIEGPINKGRTSYNIALRRSWLDIITTPIIALINKNNDGKIGLSYYFSDFNAKITHRFSDRSKLKLSFYSGLDNLYTKDKDNDYDYPSLTKNRLSWGNYNVALDWNYKFSSKFNGNFTGVFSHNLSRYHSYDSEQHRDKNNILHDYYYEDHNYKSHIYDTGYRIAFNYRPNNRNDIRFGSNYTYHIFKPQTHSQLDYNEEGDTIIEKSSINHIAHEITLYAEDEFNIGSRWTLNAGMSAEMFHISGKTFFNVDPRLAIKYQLKPNVSMKLSYTEMTQYVHKITNTFLDMPTNYWVPTTSNLNPLRSKQIAAGAYSQLTPALLVTLEGYYKRSFHIMQYSNWTGLEPPAASWYKDVMDGDGRSYGIELDAIYDKGHLQAEGSYTLSWSKRKFDDFYRDWYYDIFDNRHKLDLQLRYKFTNKISVFAAWSLRSGNKMTLPSQYAVFPNIPDGSSYETNFVYETPNNVSLPMYHRLDLGADFHHFNHHHNERIWNISLYNSYCHINTMYAKIKQHNDGSFTAKGKGFIPIIPSVSYTIKF